MFEEELNKKKLFVWIPYIIRGGTKRVFVQSLVFCQVRMKMAQAKRPPKAKPGKSAGVVGRVNGSSKTSSP